jgi:hypothetical protein
LRKRKSIGEAYWEVRAWKTLIPVCLGYFFVLLDVTVVNVALAKMGTELGTSRDGLH